MFLRLTFGGKACPSEWSVLAEPKCDLSNALLHDDDWDPTTLASPSQHRVPQPNRDEEMHRPFGVGRELVVEIPINHRGIYDIYLDDIIGLTIDMPGTNNIERSAGAHLLAIIIIIIILLNNIHDLSTFYTYSLQILLWFGCSHEAFTRR